MLPATLSDLKEVAALLAGAQLPFDDLGDYFPTGYVVVRRGGALVGCAGLERYGDSALLRSVAVAPSLRSEGVGRALVEDRLSAARALGLASVFLLTTTAAAYFRKLGFVDVERVAAPAEVHASTQFSGGCCASAACLVHRF